jgi:hypothetical protein
MRAGKGGRTPDYLILQSGSVSNHFQFSGSIDGCQELIDASHRRLFQLGIATLWNSFYSSSKAISFKKGSPFGPFASTL